MVRRPLASGALRLAVAPLRLAVSGARAHPRIAGALVVAIPLLAGGWLWLRDSSLVQVEQVRIAGLTGPQAPQVRAALTKAARDMTTLDLSPSTLSAAARPYVTIKAVRASAHPLHRLDITVTSRPPVATLPVDGERIPLAADGTLLRGIAVPGDVPALPTAPLPAGPALQRGAAAVALAAAAAAPAPLRAHVTRIFFGAHGMEADLRGGPVVYLGNGHRLRAKWVAAARMLGDPAAQGAKYLDVRIPERSVAGGLPPLGQPSTSTSG